MKNQGVEIAFESTRTPLAVSHVSKTWNAGQLIKFLTAEGYSYMKGPGQCTATNQSDDAAQAQPILIRNACPVK